jgi:hypothetical protein
MAEGPMSLSEFARAVGVSPQAMSKAYLGGRLNKCIQRGADGRPYVTDFEVAAQEWLACSRKPRLDNRPAADITLETTDLFKVVSNEFSVGAFGGLVFFAFLRGPRELVFLLTPECACAIAGEMQSAALKATSQLGNGE